MTQSHNHSSGTGLSYPLHHQHTLLSSQKKIGYEFRLRLPSLSTAILSDCSYVIYPIHATLSNVFDYWTIKIFLQKFPKDKGKCFCCCSFSLHKRKRKLGTLRHCSGWISVYNTEPHRCLNIPKIILWVLDKHVLALVHVLDFIVYLKEMCIKMRLKESYDHTKLCWILFSLIFDISWGLS